MSPASSHALRRAPVVMALAALALAGSASATFRMPTQIPADRVIANLQARATQKPSARTYLNLARAHAYAYSMGTGQIPVFSEDQMDLGTIGARPDRPDGTLPPIGEKMSRGQALDHLRAGVAAFNEAIKRDRRNTVAVYGLASLLEVGQSMAGEVNVMPMVDVEPVSEDDAERATAAVKALAEKDLPEGEAIEAARRWGQDRSYARAFAWALIRARPNATGKHLERINAAMARLWKDETRELYFEAFCLGLPDDSTATEQSIIGLSVYASYQAAKDYSRVVTDDTEFPIRKATIAAAMRAFEKLPPCGAITPIIVPLESEPPAPGAPASIDAFLAPNARVAFDLDATHRSQTWSWVSPRAGLLCWDPQNRGTITSGIQLFGSATWWLMFDDGYAAMDALDDNRDGTLTGEELNGLSLWVDANTDGVSDPGEVKPLAAFNITRLSTRADEGVRVGPHNDSLVSARGVTYASGRVAPTFDWVTRPISHASSTPHPAATSEK